MRNVDKIKNLHVLMHLECGFVCFHVYGNRQSHLVTISSFFFGSFVPQQKKENKHKEKYYSIFFHSFYSHHAHEQNRKRNLDNL